MIRVTAYQNKKLTSLGILVIVITIIALAKFTSLRQASSWQDLPVAVESTTTPTMNIDQIKVSLKDILKQYEEILAVSKQTNKNQMVMALDKLYQLSLNDYDNVKAIRNSSAKRPLNDLTQASTFLSSSLFEMKDSLMNMGNFSQIQLKNSQDDLVLAVQAMERANSRSK